MFLFKFHFFQIPQMAESGPDDSWWKKGVCEKMTPKLHVQGDDKSVFNFLICFYIFLDTDVVLKI